MAYREYGMWEILDVLRRHWRGESVSRIAAATGRSRKTARRYIARAEATGWQRTGAEPDEALAAAVLAGLRPVSETRGPGSSERRLLAHKAQIEGWLAGSEDQRALQLTRVHELLVGKGVVVPYSSLHRFAKKHLGFGERRTTLRMAEPRPGEVAEVDFGRLGLVPTGVKTGRRALWALIVTLCFSRHQFLYPTFRQTLEEFISGIERAWEFFGGVTARLVLDNLKAAVTKADRYDPSFQRTFEEYASHRGFVIDPAPPSYPTGKPKVERAVPYARNRFFDGGTFTDEIESIRSDATNWCLKVAGTRRHGTTGRAPLEMFESEERAQLRPLVGLRFDTPSWGECKVHPDHHVVFENAFYSVPTAHVGARVTVRGDRALVRIYRAGELIKTHPRQKRGERSTDYDDYPPEKRDYARRDPAWMMAKAARFGPHVHRFTERLLGGDVPWAKLRQAQKLFGLVQRFGAERLDAACQRALAFDLINVHRVETIVHDALHVEAKGDDPRQGELVQMRFERDREHFAPKGAESEEDDHVD